MGLDGCLMPQGCRGTPSGKREGGSEYFYFMLMLFLLLRFTPSGFLAKCALKVLVSLGCAVDNPVRGPE